MLKYKLLLASTLASASCEHSGQKYEWKAMYYSVDANQAMLWNERSSTDCILGTGRSEVLRRLESYGTEGRALLLIERLPAPVRMINPPPGSIVHERVRIRGVPIEPGCESSRELYWILGFRFLGPIPSNVLP